MKYFGTTDVEGQGVIITLKDKEENDDLLRSLDADDLLVIVNSLKVAEVEAISINDERIINMTDIVDINSSYIKINGDRIVAPYVIKAIGNQSYIESVLLSSGGYLDYLEKLGFEITVEKYDLLTINAYDQEISTKYIN